MVSTGTRWCMSSRCGTRNRSPRLCRTWPSGTNVAQAAYWRAAFSLAVERLGLDALRHQPLVQTDIGGREMRDKGAIEPDQPIALVKIGKTEPVFQGEIGHACLLKQTARRKPPANRRDSTCGQR